MMRSQRRTYATQSTKNATTMAMKTRSVTGGVLSGATKRRCRRTPSGHRREVVRRAFERDGEHVGQRDGDPSLVDGHGAAGGRFDFDVAEQPAAAHDRDRGHLRELEAMPGPRREAGH